MYRILYHTDSDGYAAAAVAFQYLTVERGINRDLVTFHPMNYGYPIPEELKPEDDIYMLDFAIQPLEEMEAFAQKFPLLEWVDHHQTSVDMVEASVGLSQIPGIIKTKLEHPTPNCAGGIPLAGCELAWLHFYGVEQPMPEALRLVGDWDTWRASGKGSNARLFQNYLATIEMDPRNLAGLANWIDLLGGGNHSIAELIDKGCLIADYLDRAHAGKAKVAAFECTFAELRAIAMFAGPGSPQFDSVYDTEKHDLMIAVNYSNKGYWTVHLYTETEDRVHAGKLAKRIGEAGPIPSGGGHAGAAGFQTTTAHMLELLGL